MLYREVPKNGDKLSALGFGCMRLPTTGEGKIDQPRAIRQIRSAIDRGVNYVDTAWPYHSGESELLLARALADGYRGKVKIATKLPSWMIKAGEDMDQYLNSQLEKLNTEAIDYYLLHALNGGTWDNLESLGIIDFMEKALADGRIKNAGFSFHAPLEDFKRIVDAYNWTFCQIQYNFLDQENQAGTEGLRYAAERNLAMMIMEPLRGGNIGLPQPPSEVAEIWNKTDTKRSPAEWALRWVWNHPEVTVVLSGMNDEAHIEENLSVADTALPDALTKAECDLVNAVADKYKELMKVPCTGCGYCQPCPENVRIPMIFDIYNNMHIFGNVDAAKDLYAMRLSNMIAGGEPGYASQCISCGECLEKCPQNIEIPDWLSEIAPEMEDDQMANRLEAARKRLNIEAS